MQLIDLFRNIHLQTKFTVVEYENDIIFINNEYAFTTKGNIKKQFKQYLNYKVVFMIAEDKNKLKIYIR